MWCIAGELDEAYVSRMEDILDLLEKPPDPREPVVCFDERPVQLLKEIRAPHPVRPGKVLRRDSHYRRCGTANVFAVVAPKQCLHFNTATTDRTGREVARMMKRIAKAFPKARHIHLIWDNLNTHSVTSLTSTYGEAEGTRLWKRFVIHPTPKHGSWLNPAEIEISLISRECLGKTRIPAFAVLDQRIRAWNSEANRNRRTIRWTFTSRQARRKFRYRRRGVQISLARH